MSRNTDFIPFARPTMGEEEERSIIRVLRSGWLTTGPEAAAFEREFAHFAGTSFALAVCSATAGLHLSLEALGLPHGSFVATTPYTFAASSEVIRYVGCHPFFIDIDEESYNIDCCLLEKALRENENITAILPVHIAGLPCNMNVLLELAKSFGIPVVEDAAHAFPVRSEDFFVGTRGDTGVYSFYANKTMTTGEGGMIVTDREDLAKRMRVMRLHGIDRDSWNRYTSAETGWEYRIVEAGYKYNMTDLAAALGRVQLKKAWHFLEQRRNIAKRYRQELSACDFLTLPLFRDDHAWHLFIIRLAPSQLKISRDEFIALLNKRGIGVSVHYMPLHVMPYYQKLYGYKAGDFPTAYSNYKNSISLPIYPSLTNDEVSRIVDSIKEIGYTASRKQIHSQ
jgi:dTDP-4-amino-4,6-dideoxygalactose transaminase